VITPKQRKLLGKITSLGRLLTEEEIIDFYIENNCRGTCYKIQAVNGIRTTEDRLWQVKEKAQLCYTYALGRLVIAGHFTLTWRD
jgi:hypothetical protein